MANWELKWQFDKDTYDPGDLGYANFWLKNTGETYLCLTEVRLQFEFMGEEAYNSKCTVQVKPSYERYATTIRFSVPKEIAGLIRYRVGYRLWEYSGTAERWEDFGLMWGDYKYFIRSIPRPYYRAFVARGILPEEKLVGEEIVKIIQEWGFDAHTVGIDIQPERAEMWLTESKEEIIKSDCFILVAMPRYLDAINNLWRISGPIQKEMGIAFGKDKPFLAIIDRRLPYEEVNEELRHYSVDFNPFDLEELRAKLGRVMPAFREWIVTKRWQDFMDVVRLIVPPLLIGGAVGYLLGRR